MAEATDTTGSQRRSRAAERLRRALPALVPVALVAPSLVWLARDRSVWPWDQAWYGAGSVELFWTLLHAPRQWVREMLAVVEAQAPGSVWLGQAFVPLGLLLGSVDDGLLVSVLVTNALALTLVYRALLDLSAGRHGVALAGCLTVASAPLFVGLSHQYFTEPLQLLAVAWFVHIMAAAPRRTGALTLAQLGAATAVALAAKVSSPAYCLAPGALALWHAVRRGGALAPARWREPRTLVTVAAAVLLAVATAAWYHRNLGHVIHHVSASVAGPHAEIYGAPQAFLSALLGRGRALVGAFFRPFAALAVVLVLLAGASWRRPRQAPAPRFRTAALAAGVEVAAVLCLLALSPNREPRYLLPLLPFCAVLVAHALWRSGRGPLTAAACAVLAVQLVVSHAQSLGAAPAYVYGSPWIVPPRAQPLQAAVLEELVERTCAGTVPRPRRPWNIVGIELPWLNKNSAAYAAAKALGPRGRIGCRWDSVFHFGVAEPEAVWAHVREMDLRYYVTRADVAAALPPGDAHLAAVNRHTVPILERVRASGEFTREPPLGRDPGMLILVRRYRAQ